MDEYDDSGRDNFLEKSKGRKRNNRDKIQRNSDAGTFHEEYRRKPKHRLDIYNYEEDGDNEV